MNVSPQQKKILEAGITLAGPFKPKDIADKAQIPRDTVAQQLRRLVDEKVLSKDNGSQTFTVSEEARKEWANPPKASAATISTPNTEQTTQPPSPAPQEPTEAKVSEEKASKTGGATKVLTEESAGLSPYQHFKTLGTKIGVAPELADVVTDRVFNGGKYTDIKWVYRGLSEMAIRGDIHAILVIFFVHFIDVIIRLGPALNICLARVVILGINHVACVLTYSGRLPQRFSGDFPG